MPLIKTCVIQDHYFLELNFLMLLETKLTISLYFSLSLGLKYFLFFKVIIRLRYRFTIYIYIYTHTHTHTHIYIYVYRYIIFHSYKLILLYVNHLRKKSQISDKSYIKRKRYPFDFMDYSRTFRYSCLRDCQCVQFLKR